MQVAKTLYKNNLFLLSLADRINRGNFAPFMAENSNLLKNSTTVEQRRAFSAVVTGAIIAGFSGLFIKHITLDATTLSFIRTATPTLLIGVWMLSSGIGFFRGNYKKMLLASTLNAARMYLFFVAYIYTSISIAVIMLFTWPIFVNLLGFIWLKEKVNSAQIGLLVLAFLGIVVVYLDQGFSFSNRDFIGISAALGAAFFYSFSYIIYKEEIQNYTRNEVIFYQNFVGMFVFLPFFLLADWPNVSDWSLSLVYSIMMGIVIFNFFFYGLKYLPASRASLIHYVEIVSAVLTGVIFMGDQLTPFVIIGGILILASTALLQRIT